VRAGVVHSDVLAEDAAAGFALSAVLEVDASGGDVAEESGGGEAAGVEPVDELAVVGKFAFEEAAVDAAVADDAELGEVDVLAACREGDVPAGGMPGVADLHETVDELAALPDGGLGGEDVGGGEACGLFQKLAADFAVVADVDEAEDEPGGQSPQPVADVPDARQEVARGGGGCEDERVEAPDHSPWAEERGEPGKGGYAAVERGDVWLEALGGVVVEGELEVVVYAAAVELGEVGDDGLGVFAPEDDGSAAGKRDVGDAAVEGVDPLAVAFGESVEKPAGVEGGDVGGAACGDDDGSRGFGGGALVGQDADAFVHSAGVCLGACVYNYRYIII